MKFNVKANNDNDIENAKQLELILNMKLSSYENISHIIKENTNRFKSSEPCIIDGNEALISKTESEIISYGQSINDYIIGKIDDSERVICIQHIYQHDLYKSSAMAAVIGGLNHNILIVDDIYNPMNNCIELQHNKPFIMHTNPCRERRYVNAEQSALIDKIDIPILKEVKENHPYGWYRKFEKKRF